MKSFKYVLALPLALASLTSCGGDNWTKIDVNEAISISKNFLPSVRDNKASTIGVSGHINSIKIDGSAKFKKFDPTEIIYNRDLLSLIPDFEIKNGEITVDSQEIMSTTLPGTLMTFATESIQADMFKTIVNLPKFPANPNLISTFYGVKEINYQKDLELESWGNLATTNFYKDNGRLKIELNIPKFGPFITEFNKRSGSSETDDSEFPLNLTFTTNDVGYFDSFSLNTDVKNIDLTIFDDPEVIEAYIKGNFSADFTLKFTQTFSKPMTIFYQVLEYEKFQEDEKHPEKNPDEYYSELDNDGNIVSVPLTLVKKSGLKSTLSELSNYVTFDWARDYVTTTQGNVSKTTYNPTVDDPIFNYNYWHDEDCPLNRVYSNDIYGVMIKGASGEDSQKKKFEYKVLGADYENGIKSLSSISIDGQGINNINGFDRTNKTLEAAADNLITITEDSGKTYEMDEIFINSTETNAKDSTYIINIPVMAEYED